jgi:hypothetical protein
MNQDKTTLHRDAASSARRWIFAAVALALCWRLADGLHSEWRRWQNSTLQDRWSQWSASEEERYEAALGSLDEVRRILHDHVPENALVAVLSPDRDHLPDSLASLRSLLHPRQMFHMRELRALWRRAEGPDRDICYVVELEPGCAFPEVGQAELLARSGERRLWRVEVTP